MRACVQRVSSASVSVDGGVTGSCGRGFLVLLGVGPGDDEQTARRLWEKIFRLRVFDDRDGKMNLSLAQVDGEVLVVSQFTLYADCRRGNRPSFTDAAPPELGERLYRRFLELAAKDVRHVDHGVFGADMQVSLVNDGPITIWLDTDELSRPKR
ncbi:D-aminoacyl-tRNA deacylase [Parafannyhessea umbonata]|uniref:D-aminoacyl-tRNA deacylase n=1 Tax=Parafannyhessea umbonata TaxID=604330 RepID=UPI00359C1E66